MKERIALGNERLNEPGALAWLWLIREKPVSQKNVEREALDSDRIVLGPLSPTQLAEIERVLRSGSL